VSAAEPGYRMTLAMDETLGSSGKLTATGSGSFSTANRAGTMSLDMTIPGSAAALGTIAMEVVIKGDNFYMKLPSTLGGLLPEGKAWMVLNLEQLGSAASLPGLGSLVKSEGSLSDPGQYLSYLEATSANGVKDLGTEAVDGVQTTHYRAELDLARLPDVVPAADRASTSQLVAGLEQRTHISESPIDTWIDSSDRVRRIELDYSMRIPVKTGAAPQPVSLSLTEDFTSYGPQPVPAAPPAEETMNLSSLLHGL
jgi:hypothetical protein